MIKHAYQQHRLQKFDMKSKTKSMIMNWCNRNQSPALKTLMGKQPKLQMDKQKRTYEHLYTKRCHILYLNLTKYICSHTEGETVWKLIQKSNTDSHTKSTALVECLCIILSFKRAFNPFKSGHYFNEKCNVVTDVVLTLPVPGQAIIHLWS